MRSPGTAVALVVVLLAGCAAGPAPSVVGSPGGSSSGSAVGSVVVGPSAATPVAPSPAAATPVAPSPTPAATTRELALGADPLPSGRYTRTGFRPPISIDLDDGWFAGTLSDGFFDVQQDRGTPDVVAVQFGRVQGVVGSGGSITPATTAADAARAIHENPGVVVIEESGSRLGGLDGLNVTVENRGATTAPILDVSPGRLGIDPARRLWISLFDTTDGVLAVMVGGSVARWDHALGLAEPVLESVLVGAPGR